MISTTYDICDRRHCFWVVCPWVPFVWACFLLVRYHILQTIGQNFKPVTFVASVNEAEDELIRFKLIVLVVGSRSCRHKVKYTRRHNCGSRAFICSVHNYTRMCMYVSTKTKTIGHITKRSKGQISMSEYFSWVSYCRWQRGIHVSAWASKYHLVVIAFCYCIKIIMLDIICV